MGAGCTRCISVRSPTEPEFRASVREEIQHLRVGLKLHEERQRQKVTPRTTNTSQEPVVVLDDIVRAQSASSASGGSSELQSKLKSGPEKLGISSIQHERSQRANRDEFATEVKALTETNHVRIQVRSRSCLKALRDPPQQQPMPTAAPLVRTDSSTIEPDKPPLLKNEATSAMRISCATFGSNEPSALWQRRYGPQAVRLQVLKVPYVPK